MADPKTMKATATSNSGIVIGENSVRATVNDEHGILINEKGTTLTGPLSFAVGPDQIRVGGLFTFQGAIMGMLPSTMATPSPMYKMDPPLKQLASVAAQTALIATLIGLAV